MMKMKVRREPRPVILAARRLLREARERGGVFVRPDGDTWKRAGTEWRAARLLLESGRAVVYGTKFGWLSSWNYREVIVGTPEMDAHLSRHYPGCKIQRPV
jgi:hypothetical protein